MQEYKEYNKAYLRAVETITGVYFRYQKEERIRDIIYKSYCDARLDPDGKALRYAYGVRCTADGLISMRRITNMEKDITQIVPVYTKYRRIPIFFFPSECGGINTTRAKTFGDRIDYTLYDLKKYFLDKATCFMIDAYNRPKTRMWLEGMRSFENLIDWLGVKGIFTDDSYNVFDLEYADNRVISGYRTVQEYQDPWSAVYYTNLKFRIEMYEKGMYQDGYSGF